MTKTYSQVGMAMKTQNLFPRPNQETIFTVYLLQNETFHQTGQIFMQKTTVEYNEKEQDLKNLSCFKRLPWLLKEKNKILT